MFALLMLALLALLMLGGRWLEQRSAQPESRGDLTQRYAREDLTEWNGAVYRPRGNVTTILLMGVDKPGTAATSQSYRNGGQADFLRLLMIDSERKTVEQLEIDRDTMTPITILGVLGNEAGSRIAQLSLSHGFGDGGQQSCELTVQAVSRLLLGVPIDFYIAMNLDGIATLNDMLGGVTVTLEDDFSAMDPAMTQGATLTLQGRQAEVYVRSRMSMGIGTNEARMERQEQYMSQLMQQLTERMATDQAFIGRLYDELSPWLTTNLSRGRIINEAWAARNYARTETLGIPGEHRTGSDGFMQFHADADALQRLVMELFYEEAK